MAAAGAAARMSQDLCQLSIAQSLDPWPCPCPCPLVRPRHCSLPRTIDSIGVLPPPAASYISTSQPLRSVCRLAFILCILFLFRSLRPFLNNLCKYFVSRWQTMGCSFVSSRSPHTNCQFVTRVNCRAVGMQQTVTTIARCEYLSTIVPENCLFIVIHRQRRPRPIAIVDSHNAISRLIACVCSAKRFYNSETHNGASKKCRLSVLPITHTYTQVTF